MQSKNPTSALIFAAIASDGKLMTPHLTETWREINPGEYLKILKDVLMPWFRDNYGHSKAMVVQDSEPARGA